MIYQFKVKGRLKVSCGQSRYEEAHRYMCQKYGEGKYNVFEIDSTISDEIKESLEFKKLLDKIKN